MKNGKMLMSALVKGMIIETENTTDQVEKVRTHLEDATGGHWSIVKMRIGHKIDSYFTYKPDTHVVFYHGRFRWEAWMNP